VSISVIANHHISPEIVDLIANAKKKVDLVSPYVKLWPHLENEIGSALKRGVKIQLFFISDKREEYEDYLLRLAMMSVAVYQIDLLHAKVYLSESIGIASSMNLYDFSAQRNEDIAAVSSDPGFVRSLDDYVQKLSENRARSISSSLKGQKAIKAVGGVLKAVAGAVAGAVTAAVFERVGFCIRCKAEIDYNPDKPLCPDCYGKWKKYGDPTYKEKYCHDCGKPSRASLAKPVCRKCYKASV